MATFFSLLPSNAGFLPTKVGTIQGDAETRYQISSLQCRSRTVNYVYAVNYLLTTKYATLSNTGIWRLFGLIIWIVKASGFSKRHTISAQLVLYWKSMQSPGEDPPKG